MSDTETLTCSSSGDELLQIAQTLRSAASEGQVLAQRTGDGLRLVPRRTLGSEASLRDFVRRESECCPFFEFTVTEQQAELWLEMVGPAGAQALLDLLFRLVQPPISSTA